MTLDEQLAWMPRADAIERELQRIFGAETKVYFLWDERETWEEANDRIDRDIVTTADRRARNSRSRPDADVAVSRDNTRGSSRPDSATLF